MECGDSWPPLTGEFIRPRRFAHLHPNQPRAQSLEGEINFAFEGGDESPHPKIGTVQSTK